MEIIRDQHIIEYTRYVTLTLTLFSCVSSLFSTAGGGAAAGAIDVSFDSCRNGVNGLDPHAQSFLMKLLLQ